jgi:integrase
VSGKRQFGTIRRLPSGRWQARHRGANGRLVGAPRTFKTKADAARWLATVEADKARGVWLDPVAGKVPLADYARAWLQAKATIAPRTREIYELQLRLHVLPEISTDVPALGPVYLRDLTPEVVRAWYAALAAVRGTSVAAKAYVRLRQILNQAVNDDRIAKNPCRIEGGGAERHAEQRFVTLPELYQLAGAVPARYRALVLTAGLAGLRQGELFALRLPDVDLLRAVITVRRKRLRLASGEVIEGHPKSEAGRRRVALPRPLTEELEHHLGRYSGDGLERFVFVSESGVPVDPNNFRSRVWIPATRAAGLEGVRFHDLRHAAGTLAAQTGATTKEIMARLGHASPRAAMVYQHASEDRDRLIADKLGQMATEAGLAGSPTPTTTITRRAMPEPGRDGGEAYDGVGCQGSPTT